MEYCSENLQGTISLYSATGCNMSLQLHFLPFLLIIFSKNRGAFPINMEKVSVKIFPKLKRGTVENGVRMCWLSTAGVLQGRITSYLRDKRRQIGCPLNFFKQDTVYRGIIYYLLLHIVIRITFCYKGSSLILSSLP